MRTSTEMSHQLRVRAAFKKAQELVGRLGEEHPASLLAIIEAVNLQDPSFLDQVLAEVGITKPTSTHVDTDGSPLYSTESISAALGEPHEAVLRRVDELVDQGLMDVAPSGHRIQ